MMLQGFKQQLELELSLAQGKGFAQGFLSGALLVGIIWIVVVKKN